MKYNDLKNFSNPDYVMKKAKEDYGMNIEISDRKDKKYMVQNPEGKWIHFGQMGYEDYTYHNDKVRRNNFRKRNHKWANFPKYSPAFLSYHLLW